MKTALLFSTRRARGPRPDLSDASLTLDVAEPVGDEREAVLRAQGGDHLSCAFDQVAGAGEVAEVDGTEHRRRQRLAQGLEDQLEPA
jgi:hypothetical protein